MITIYIIYIYKIYISSLYIVCGKNMDSCTRINYIGLTYQHVIWTASSEFGTYRLCEQRRFRRACASAQSRQNLRCSLIQAVSQEEPSDRKPEPWPFWIAGHALLKFVMTECSKTQIRLTGLIWNCFQLWLLQDADFPNDCAYFKKPYYTFKTCIAWNDAYA